MPHYFDYAATQPMRQSAIDAWVAAAGSLNSGAQYGSGRKARSVLDDAREKVASLLGCEPIEVIFTSSGTEADNIAIQGLYAAGQTNRIISTDIEHPAVRDTVSKLEKTGAAVDILPVDRSGHIADLSALDTLADVATCMWANNETGAIQPIEEIATRANATGTPVHVDAVQAVGKVPITSRRPTTPIRRTPPTGAGTFCYRGGQHHRPRRRQGGPARHARLAGLAGLADQRGKKLVSYLTEKFLLI